MSNNPVSTSVWTKLKEHKNSLVNVHMRELFANDPGRFDKFSFQVDGLLADFSKHRMTDETLPLLLDLARARDVEGWRKKMFAGEKINTTEGRAVLHTALRRPAGDAVEVDGENVMPFIHDTLDRIKIFRMPCAPARGRATRANRSAIS